MRALAVSVASLALATTGIATSTWSNVTIRNSTTASEQLKGVDYMHAVVEEDPNKPVNTSSAGPVCENPPICEERRGNEVLIGIIDFYATDGCADYSRMANEFNETGQCIYAEEYQAQLTGRESKVWPHFAHNVNRLPSRKFWAVARSSQDPLTHYPNFPQMTIGFSHSQTTVLRAAPPKVLMGDNTRCVLHQFAGPTIGIVVWPAGYELPFCPFIPKPKDEPPGVAPPPPEESDDDKEDEDHRPKWQPRWTDEEKEKYRKYTLKHFGKEYHAHDMKPMNKSQIDKYFPDDLDAPSPTWDDVKRLSNKPYRKISNEVIESFRVDHCGRLEKAEAKHRMHKWVEGLGPFLAILRAVIPKYKDETLSHKALKRVKDSRICGRFTPDESRRPRRTISGLRQTSDPQDCTVAGNGRCDFAQDISYTQEWTRTVSRSESISATVSCGGRSYEGIKD